MHTGSPDVLCLYRLRRASTVGSLSQMLCFPTSPQDTKGGFSIAVFAKESCTVSPCCAVAPDFFSKKMKTVHCIQISPGAAYPSNT